MTGIATDLDLIREAAVAGGKVALGYFRKDPARWTKEGDSPVSEADLAVDLYLRNMLTAARPDYGWLSEETADDPGRIGRRRTFVVDPIDGTRAFLGGSEDWTVAVAVVENSRPIAAALYRPTSADLYSAVAGGGAFRNGEPISVSAREKLKGAQLSGPPSIARHDNLKAEGVGYAGYVPSLAYRLALVAEGRIDLAAARARACDWDLAAADLLVQEAGGRLTDLDGRPIAYNRADVRHPALIAGPEVLAGRLSRILASVL